MRPRKMLVALIAATLLMAVAAAGAQAAQWKIAGSAFTGSESVSAERHGAKGAHPVPLVLHSELLGVEVTLTPTGVECVSCTITGGGTKSAGKLKFTGITIDINGKAAPKCEVSGNAVIGTVETNALVDEVIMDTDIPGSELVFDKFAAATAGGPIVKLKFASAVKECALEGQEPEVTGTFCGDTVETKSEGPPATWTALKTGQEKVTQTQLFGELQQNTGVCELKLGKHVAQLDGAIDFKLSGTKAGSVFGVS